MTSSDRAILAAFSERIRHVVPTVTPELREHVYAAAWEIGFHHDCTLIAPALLSRDDFEEGPMSASTLVANIRREGVAA